MSSMSKEAAEMREKFLQRVEDPELREIIDRGGIISAINRSLLLRDYSYTTEDAEQLEVVRELVEWSRTQGHTWPRVERRKDTVA